MTRTPSLQITHHAGHQVHPIGSVEIYISHDAVTSSTLLNLEIKCPAAVADTAPEDSRAGWSGATIDLWIPVPSLEPAELDDYRVHIAEAYRADHDAFNRLYVFEHNAVWAIDVVLEVIGGRLWVACDGLSRDPNYLDDRMPPARVALRAWVDLARL
jgi:hypothetical protein